MISLSSPRGALRAGVVALVPALTAAAGADAQVAIVDEGSFTVTRGGARLGREEFRIVRQPAGAASNYMARATAAYGERRITPALQTDGDGTPERYQVEVRRGGSVEQRVSAQAAGAHFRAQTVSEGSEAAREYLLDAGTVIVDDELYHHYYFLVRRAQPGGGRVTVVAPRRGAQAVVAVALTGSERMSVAGRPVDARHYVVTGAPGGRRDVWADEQGRVLRVVLAGDGTEVLRDDLPR